MSEKEQARALKLLREWMERFAGELPPAFMTAEQRATFEATQEFLSLPSGPESHGSRRG